MEEAAAEEVAEEAAADEAPAEEAAAEALAQAPSEKGAESSLSRDLLGSRRVLIAATVFGLVALVGGASWFWSGGSDVADARAIASAHEAKRASAYARPPSRECFIRLKIQTAKRWLTRCSKV